jgi:hypothetical protein
LRIAGFDGAARRAAGLVDGAIDGMTFGAQVLAAAIGSGPEGLLSEVAIDKSDQDVRSVFAAPPDQVRRTYQDAPI